MIRRELRNLVFATALCLGASSMDGQEVRRAVPVNEPPTPPAVPLEAFENPTPAPTAAPRPRATPTAPPVAAPAEPVTPPAPAITTPDQQQLELANGFYARKLYEMAAPEYEKYLGMYVQGAERHTALFRLAESYRAMGNLNAAKNSYEMLLSASPNGEFVGPAAFRLADLYFQEKNYSGALPLYRRAAVRVKDPAVVTAAKFYMARSLENLKQTVEARVTYEEVLATKGDNPFREASRLSLVPLYTDIGRKADALKQLQAVAEETTNAELKAEATVRAGLLQIDLGQTEKAAVELKKALKLPSLGKWKEIAQVGLLRLLYESGKYKQLLEGFDPDSKDISPETRPEVLLIAANSNRQLGNHKAARNLYDQLITEFPNSTAAREAQYNRLVALYSSEDPDLIKEVDAYLAANPEPEKRDQVQLLKAEALYRKGNFQEAAPVYAALQDSKLAPNYKAEALFKLGWCSMELKDYAAAVKAFTTFLQNHSADKLAPAALAQRAVANQQQKNFEAALKDFNQLISKYPKARERELALQQKALILGQKQDNAGMAEAFRQLLKEYPKTAAAAQANYWIGWAAFENKDYKEAVDPLTKSRTLDSEEFFERATLRLMLAQYYLEDRDAVAKEIDSYLKNGKSKVPVEVLRWLAGEYLIGKNHEQSEKYYSILVKREDAVPEDWLNLARSELRQQKFTEAEKSAAEYLKLVKEPHLRANGLLVAGEAQLGLKNYVDAQKSADEACSLQPEGKLNALGRILSGDVAMAKEEFETAGKIYLSVSVVFEDPVITPHALEKASIAYKKAGDSEKAAKTLNTLQTRYPEYPLTAAKP